jgi:hypothetical protein
MKMEEISKYLQKQQITHTKEGVESFDSEIDDLFTLTQFIFIA